MAYAAAEVSTPTPDLELSQAMRRYAAFAAPIVASGLVMPFVAEQLAARMGWSESFVGTQLVAVATSLPEIAVTVHAVRIGALDMAVAGTLGSNLFNVTTIALMYRPTRRLWRGLDAPALAMLALYLANAWTAFGQ